MTYQSTGIFQCFYVLVWGYRNMWHPYVRQMPCDLVFHSYNIFVSYTRRKFLISVLININA